MAANCYMVTAQRSESVTYSVMAQFTSPNDTNLIVAKTHHIEVFIVTTDGLKLHAELPVFGSIKTIRRFRPAKEPQDLLFFITQKYDVAVLAYDAAKGKVVTRASANVSSKVGREAETGLIVAVDPLTGLIGCRIYDSLLTLIEYEHGSRILKANDMRFSDSNIIDLTFLYGYGRSVSAIRSHNCQTSQRSRTFSKSTWRNRVI